MARLGRRGLAGAATSTPRRLRQLLWVLVIGSLAWGAVAAITADQHASAASDVNAVSEPLSLDAEQIYQYLSDADTTAATAFLAGGLEPAAARQQYNTDIASAGLRIESASALVGASAARDKLPGALSTQAHRTATATGDDLATLTSELPVYAGYVATANADIRLGLPVGAAYLREADTLLRGRLLVAANDIYQEQNAQLTRASAQATGLPLMIFALLLGLAICVVLIRSGRWLTRRTNRVLNTGLLGALVIAVIALAWLGTAFTIGRSDLLHAQQSGSVPAQVLAQADVAALNAHTDDTVTLINSAGDDSNQTKGFSYQRDFRTQQGRISKQLGMVTGQARLVSDAGAWFSAHHSMRAADDVGDHSVAVRDAQSGQDAAAFAALSNDLTSVINADQAVFADSAKNGRGAFTGLAIGMIVAALLMAASCAWGLNRRLAEYR